MTVQDREEKLTNILAFEEAYFPKQIEGFLYRRNRVRLGSILRGIAGLESTRALYSYFIEGKSDELKQHCYLATKLTLASAGQDGGADFEIVTDFLYALLSDNDELINAIANVETPALLRERNNPLASRSLVFMFQLAIREEAETLKHMIEKVAKNGRKLNRAEAAEGRDFFSLLLKRDQAALEDLIQNHARKKDKDALSEDFLSIIATLETKLCWLKGIPVQIDSPLVPMILMPVSPLTHYDDFYDFLAPGWTPPRQGLLGKLGRILKK